VSYLTEEVNGNVIQRGRSGGKRVRCRTVGQANQIYEELDQSCRELRSKLQGLLIKIVGNTDLNCREFG
jgi:hypothetical protein